MTQALNLANFANNLNTSGATSNAGLQNSSVTVTAGTGMSGGGAVALGSSVTLTNAGVTSLSAGTGISVSASTGGITITNTAPAAGSGTVTSVATGNGLSGGTITTSGTLVLAAPSFNSVGSYAFVNLYFTTSGSSTSGSNYSAGSGNGQMRTFAMGYGAASCVGVIVPNGGCGTAGTNNLSGTWKWMGAPNAGDRCYGIACRVS